MRRTKALTIGVIIASAITGVALIFPLAESEVLGSSFVLYRQRRLIKFAKSVSPRGGRRAENRDRKLEIAP